MAADDTSEGRRLGTITALRLRKLRAHIGNPKAYATAWAGVLDLALMLWVLRVPVLALAAGALVLGQAPQAYDLMFEVSVVPMLAAEFILLLILWMAVTYYSCFLLLGTDQRFLNYARARSSVALDYARIVTPFVLASVPPIIIAMSTIRSGFNVVMIDDLPTSRAINLSLTAFFCLITALFAVTAYCFVRQPKIFKRVFRRLEDFGRSVDRWFSGVPLIGRSFRVDVLGSDLTSFKPQYFGPWLLFVVFLTSISIFLLGPAKVAAWFPRALIIPVLLGGWLPLLVWLSAYGRKLRAPLISGGLFSLAIISELVGDNHAIRRFSDDVALQQSGGALAGPYGMRLDQAVELWMHENGCTSDPAQCPRPIVVAAAGGASRAGFFTASVIGKLMDDAERNVAATPALDPAAVRKRIFAISAVSGGSVGATMAVAAMAKAGSDTTQPCTNRGPSLWYGAYIHGWQDCLEALTAGDFLTAVVLGLIFNDRITFAWWPDRAAVLEQSWEDRFARLTAPRSAVDLHRECPADLRCPFMSLQPRPGMWLPLLVLNGTSASVGRRVITSSLKPVYHARTCPLGFQRRASVSRAQVSNVPGEQCSLFLEAHPFHELLSLQRPGSAVTPVNDVSISTAAHNSARFPIISPPGALRDRQNRLIDYIIDGGYIDNYGALTASELAEAIHAIQPQLAPFILAISNDPDEDPDLVPLKKRDGGIFGAITVPVTAIESVRGSRGRANLMQAQLDVDQIIDPACGPSAAHIRVWPSFGSVSAPERLPSVPMSWAVSIPVQIHLHQQLEGGRNQNQNHAEVEKIWMALDKPPGCIGQQAITP